MTELMVVVKYLILSLANTTVSLLFYIVIIDYLFESIKAEESFSATTGASPTGESRLFPNTIRGSRK